MSRKNYVIEEKTLGLDGSEKWIKAKDSPTFSVPEIAASYAARYHKLNEGEARVREL